MGRIANTSDFVTGPLNEFGRTVTYFPVTKLTDNQEGDETIEPGIAREILVVLYPMTVNRSDPGREGLFEQGDARLFSLPSDNVQFNDLIEWEGRFYRLGRPVERYASEEASDRIYDYTICHLFEGIPSGPVPGSGRFLGGFAGIPESIALGDWWYDNIAKQYKGLNATEIIILG